jgi:hypothetical protein
LVSLAALRASSTLSKRISGMMGPNVSSQVSRMSRLMSVSTVGSK